MQLAHFISLYLSKTFFKVGEGRDFLVVQWLRLCLLTQGVQVRFLVKELRSHMPHGQNTKMWNRNNTIRNPIKTLKMVHIKKILKKWEGRGSMGFNGACDCHHRSNFFPFPHCASCSARQKASPSWQGVSKPVDWDLKFTLTEYA